MIGTELLNLMYGNPYNQMAGAMAPTTAPTPTPNVTPKPGAPPTLQTPPPNKPPYWDPTGSVVRNMGPVSQPGAGGSPSPSPAPQTASAPPASGGAPTAQTPPAAQASPPDLAQLYFQLQNRNRSANEIDRGLSLMAASVSTPSMANAIMGSVGRGEQNQDPGTMLQQLMQLRYLQSIQGVGAPQGIDPSTWAMLPPDAKIKVIGDQAGKQVALQGDRQKEVYDANMALPNLNKSMTDMDNGINIIKNTQEGDTTALQNILSNQSKKNAVASMLNAKESEGWLTSWMEQHQQQWAALTPAEQAVAMQMKQLGGQVYGEAFSSLGGQSRRSTQEVGGIKAGLSQVNSINQPYISPDGQSGYLPALNRLQDMIHRGQANAYGAAQQLDSLPDNLKWDANGKPLMDAQYLPGGALYDGKGGQWSLNPPPKQGGTDFSKMSDSDARAAYDKLPTGTIYTGPDGKQYRKT